MEGATVLPDGLRRDKVDVLVIAGEEKIVLRSADLSSVSVAL
jgi:hypothetical protein